MSGIIMLRPGLASTELIHLGKMKMQLFHTDTLIRISGADHSSLEAVADTDRQPVDHREGDLFKAFCLCVVCILVLELKANSIQLVHYLFLIMLRLISVAMSTFYPVHVMITG